MERGIRLAEHYLLEALRLTTVAPANRDMANAEEIRKWLVEKWAHDEVLPSDILKNGPSALRDNLIIKKAIQTLVVYGWLQQLEPYTLVRGKNRKAAYRIVRS